MEDPTRNYFDRQISRSLKVISRAYYYLVFKDLRPPAGNKLYTLTRARLSTSRRGIFAHAGDASRIMRATAGKARVSIVNRAAVSPSLAASAVR